MPRCVAIAVLLLLVPPAGAAEHVVGQKERQFRQGETKLQSLTVKTGDTVAFRNDDRFTHSVMSRTAGQEFDLGSMRPGASGEHRFATPGALEVECALHPQMKFKVEVVP